MSSAHSHIASHVIHHLQSDDKINISLHLLQIQQMFDSVSREVWPSQLFDKYNLSPPMLENSHNAHLHICL